ncbi:hypothetical protein CYLTODRAFT_444134 [Cylindrobasidium torrendii FP15055 ss-10]|uniref:Yeast cell wall synthesis Kre9/Knh1-like N-terminal domain-containing protein n=1 Tax=Cylindrobasidium torrendii FP15055 ss-10 TaxID=1314674 RepID=A0A0D7BAV3_9AGAR|nr:hypothetical protein CYLTODRAFT_444134 [Cylindrobasidium torrendii FP15055 ss-10]
MLVLSLVTVLAAASFASADVSITFPVETSTMSGGWAYNVTWLDNGKTSYTYEEFGPATFSIAVGDAETQVILQTIGTDIDLNSQMFEFKVDAAIGPNSDAYFIRVDSTSYIDPATGYNAQAFSAKYNFDQMTGEFDASTAAIAASNNEGSSSSASVKPTSSASVKKWTTHSTETVAAASASASAGTAGSLSATGENGAAGMSNNMWLGIGLGAAIGLTFV